MQTTTFEPGAVHAMKALAAELGLTVGEALQAVMLIAANDGAACITLSHIEAFREFCTREYAA